MSAIAFAGSSSQRTTGPRTLTWVYHSSALSAVSATSGRSRIQRRRARPASMLGSTVPSSSTRYHVATDIGAPLGLSTATTAGLGRANSSATSGGSGALGMGVLLGRCRLGLSRVRRERGDQVVRPVVVSDLGVPPQSATGHGNRGRVAQRAVAVRRGCRRAAGICDERRPAIRRPGDAGALEPVLVGRGPAVVEHDERVPGEHRRDPGTPGVPGAGSAAQYLAEVVPGEPVVAAEQAGRHPVLVAGPFERVAAQPHPPAVVVDEHDGVLDGALGAPGVDDGAAAPGQRGWGIGIECLHPPSGRRTRAGRSRDAAPNASRPTCATLSKRTPSAERATPTPTPRPSS